MATIEQQARTRPPRAIPSSPPRGGPAWRWLLASAVLLSLLAVLLAPIVVTSTPLGEALVGWCLGELHGSISVGSISAGWLSPLGAKDIVIRDAAGHEALRVDAAIGDKSLLGLLGNRRSLGKFRIEGCKLALVSRADGSNLEEIFAYWINSPGQGGGSGLEIELVDATISIADESSGVHCDLEHVNLDLRVGAESATNIEIALAGTLRQADASGPIELKGSVALPPAGSGGRPTHGNVALKAEYLPLGAAQAIACRVVPNTKLAGVARADWTCQWTVPAAGSPQADVSGTLSIAGLAFNSPRLGTDVFQADALELPCEMHLQAGRLEVRQLGVRSELGQASCQAGLVVPDGAWQSLASPADWSRLLKGASIDASGSANVARLAQMLPRLVALRDDVRLTSGQIDWQLQARTAGSSTAWQGQVLTSRLAGLCQGREVACEKPLAVRFAATADGQKFTVEQLEAQSDFLSLSGSGTLDNCQATASCDLTRIGSELAKFVDLAGWQLAGQLAAQLKIAHAADGTISLGAEAQVAQFAVTSPTAAYTEPQLALTAQAQAVAGRQDGLALLKQAQLTLAAGADRLSATLAKEVARPGQPSLGSWQVDVTGGSDTWFVRLRPWLSLTPAWQAGGACEAHVLVEASTAALQVTQAQVALAPCQFACPGIVLNDPQCQIQATGEWSRATGDVEISKLALRANTVSADVDGWKFNAQQGLASLAGKVVFAADVARLQAAAADPNKAATWQLSGQLNGQATVQAVGGRPQAQMAFAVQNLAAVSASGKNWNEPLVELAVTASYDRSADALVADQVDFRAQLAEIRATGRIEHATTQPALQLAGQIDYDLARISVVLEPYCSGNLMMAGKQSRAFSLSGPLVPADVPEALGSPVRLAPLAGKLELGWDSAEAFGFACGPAVAQFELSGGTARLLPLAVGVNQGRAQVEAQAQLEPPPGVLILPGGPVLDHVDMSRAVTSRLMFLVPMMSNSEIRGQFSVALDGGRVPLADPATADVSGQLTIHSMEVGLGPFAQEMATLLREPMPARLTKETQVRFRLVGGRVYHEGLELSYPELTIRTSGSVGLDRTLDLVAEMPILPRWFGNVPLPERLKNETLKVPIRGTLERPQIDAVQMRKSLADVGGFFERTGDRAVNVLESLNPLRDKISP